MTRRSRQLRRERQRRPSFGYDVSEAEAADFLGISSRDRSRPDPSRSQSSKGDVP
jgi:hypothetical protein